MRCGEGSMSIGEIFSASVTCIVFWIAALKCIPNLKENRTWKQRLLLRILCALAATFALVLAVVTKNVFLTVIFYIIMVLSALLVALQELVLSRK